MESSSPADPRPRTRLEVIEISFGKERVWVMGELALAVKPRANGSEQEGDDGDR